MEQQKQKQRKKRKRTRRKNSGSRREKVGKTAGRWGGKAREGRVGVYSPFVSTTESGKRLL